MPNRDQGIFEEDSDLPTGITIRPLGPPKEFKSQLPPAVMKNLSLRDRDILNTMNVVAQQMDWTTDCVMTHREHVIMLEKRLARLERVSRFVLSRWGVVTATILYLSPYVVPKLMLWANGK